MGRGRNRNAVKAAELLGIGYTHALRLVRAASESGKVVTTTNMMDEVKKRLEQERASGNNGSHAHHDAG